jgi:hypothetical protein
MPPFQFFKSAAAECMVPAWPLPEGVGRPGGAGEWGSSPVAALMTALKAGLGWSLPSNNKG